MKLKRKGILSVLVTIWFWVVVADNIVRGQARSQESRPVLTIQKNNRPALEGTVVGDLDPLAFKRDKPKASVLAHPTPRVFLIFNQPGRQSDSKSSAANHDRPIRVALSPSAKRELTPLWKALLAYLYESKVEGVADAKTQASVDGAILRSIMMTEARLQQLPVNAPDGRRSFSANEAESIVKFLSMSADNLVEQARKLMGPK